MEPNARAYAQVLNELDFQNLEITAADDSLIPALRDSVEPENRDYFITLSSLVNRASVVMRLPTLQVPDTIQERAAIEHACLSLGEENPFFPSRKFAGFHQALSSTMHELRTWDIHPQHLFSAARDCEPVFQAKLVSLGNLILSIEEILKQIGRGYRSNQMVEHLALNADFSRWDPIHIFLGADRNPLLTKWLQWLASEGAQVNAYISGIPHSHELFSQAKLIASDLNVPVDEITHRHWSAELFTANQIDEPETILEQFSALDPMTEVEWVVRRCLRAQSEGMLATRIAILARDRQLYLPLLNAAAKVHGLQIVVQMKAELSSNAFIAALLDLLDAIAAETITHLRLVVGNSYFQVPPELRVRLLEEIFNIMRRDGDAWEILREQSTEIGAVWIQNLIDQRQKANESPRKLTEWLVFLRELVQLDPLATSVSSNENPTQERDKHAKNSLEHALANYASVYDVHTDRALSLVQFIQILRAIIDHSDVTLPTSARDGIRVVSDPNRLVNCESLFVLGTIEGSLPRRRNQDVILDDRERETLQQILTDKAPLLSSIDLARKERDLFAEICAAPSQKLTFSYPLTYEDREFAPAYYLNELNRLVKGKITHQDFGRNAIVPQIEDCVSYSDIQLRQALNQKVKNLAFRDISSEVAQIAIRRNVAGPYSVAEIFTYERCPFQAWFRYYFEIFPSVKATASRGLSQIPDKSHLAIQDTAEQMRQALDFEVEQYLKKVFTNTDLTEWLVLENLCQRLKQEWIEREVESRENWGSSADRTLVDVELGQYGTANSIPVKGIELEFRDRIPAIVQFHGYDVLQFYRRSDRTLLKNDGTPTDDLAPYALFMLLTYPRNRNLAISIDSMSGKRSTYFRNDDQHSSLPQPKDKQKNAPKRLNLSEKEMFRDLVRKRLETALENIRKPSIQATPTEQACQYCQYGELCRVSSQYGETEQGGFGLL